MFEAVRDKIESRSWPNKGRLLGVVDKIESLTPEKAAFIRISDIEPDLSTPEEVARFIMDITPLTSSGTPLIDLIGWEEGARGKPVVVDHEKMRASLNGDEGSAEVRIAYRLRAEHVIEHMLSHAPETRIIVVETPAQAQRYAAQGEFCLFTNPGDEAEFVAWRAHEKTLSGRPVICLPGGLPKGFVLSRPHVVAALPGTSEAHQKDVEFIAFICERWRKAQTYPDMSS